MRLPLAVLALLALAGCAADDAGPGDPATSTAAAPATTTTTSTASEPPRMVPLECRTPSEAEGRNGTVVIREPEAFEPWFQSHCGGGDGPPAIDFNVSMVVAYFWGEKSSGGYQAVVSGYVPTGEVGSVRVTRVSPGATCVTPAVLTYPMAAAVVTPRRDQVEFLFKDVVHECG